MRCILNYPHLKSSRHLSSHKSLAQELKKSEKEITNTKRHAALNVRRLPPAPQEFKRIITLPSLITTQRSVRAARNIVCVFFFFLFLSFLISNSNLIIEGSKTRRRYSTTVNRACN